MLRLTESILYTEPREDTDRPVLALISGSKRSLMIDGGNSPAHTNMFLEELQQHRLRAPDFVAITHAHCDHIFGLSSLSGMIIANQTTEERIAELQQLCWEDEAVAARITNGQEYEMTAKMLQLEIPGERSGFKICSPDLVYRDHLTIDLGGLTCQIQWVGGDHAADSAVIYVPERGVAFIGDCLYLRKTDRATVNELFEKLFSFPADLYVDSHEARPISRNEMKERYRALESTS